jgi:hypothetical protein
VYCALAAAKPKSNKVTDVRTCIRLLVSRFLTLKWEEGTMNIAKVEEASSGSETMSGSLVMYYCT